MVSLSSSDTAALNPEIRGEQFGRIERLGATKLNGAFEGRLDPTDRRVRTCLSTFWLVATSTATMVVTNANMIKAMKIFASRKSWMWTFNVSCYCFVVDIMG